MLGCEQRCVYALDQYKGHHIYILCLNGLMESIPSLLSVLAQQILTSLVDTLFASLLSLSLPQNVGCLLDVSSPNCFQHGLEDSLQADRMAMSGRPLISRVKLVVLLRPGERLSGETEFAAGVVIVDGDYEGAAIAEGVMGERPILQDAKLGV